VNQDEVMETFRQAGALLEGHFILRSGLRSREFFQCATALEKMPTVEKLGKALADKVRSLEIDTVVAPAMGGLVIGQEVARQLGARFIFVEKEDGSLVLRRGFKFYPEEKVLIVEDVVTRGGRADEAINIVQQEGGKLAALAVLVDRSNGKYEPKTPFYSLLTMEVETYDPENLPEDLKSIPPEKPGSK
jgi:orotate phosphoribosyltransferase